MKYKFSDKHVLSFDSTDEEIRHDGSKCYCMDAEGHSICLGYASNLLNRGVIIEVKPREWWEYDEPNHHKSASFQRFYTLEDAYKFFGMANVNLIKVREVI